MGSFGDIGCFSSMIIPFVKKAFYLAAGEGGVLVTNNKKFLRELYLLKIFFQDDCKMK